MHTPSHASKPTQYNAERVGVGRTWWGNPLCCQAWPPWGGWESEACLYLGVSVVALATSCRAKALWQGSSRPLPTPVGGGTWECSCTPEVWQTSRWTAWVLGGAWHENFQLGYWVGWPLAWWGVYEPLSLCGLWELNQPDVFFLDLYLMSLYSYLSLAQNSKKVLWIFCKI